MHTVCLRIKTMWVRLVKLKWAYVLCGPHLINWFCNSVSACIILVLSIIFLCVDNAVGYLPAHCQTFNKIWLGGREWLVDLCSLFGFLHFSLTLFAGLCARLRVWLNFHSYPWKHVIRQTLSELNHLNCIRAWIRFILMMVDSKASPHFHMI